MSDVVRAMFESLRSQVDALQIMWEHETGAAPVLVAPETCDHPEDKRRETPVSGKPRQYQCGVCLHLVNPDAPGGQE